jgi:DNA (cytosine-5)-methyltransferase 1
MVTPSTRARIRTADLPNERGVRIILPPLIGAADGEARWLAEVQSATRPVALDLFCGAGGLSQGFQDAGFFVAAGLDSEPRSVETHAASFLAKSRVIDLKGITADQIRTLVQVELGLPRVDVVIGGPPCQGFASVGRAKIRSLSAEQRESLAERNHLYQEFVRFVEVLQPSCFVMENVPHLATYQEGRVQARIREDFERLGYDIGTADAPGVPLLLEAAEFGVPQTRRRLFFLGFRRGHTAPVLSPRPTHTGQTSRARTRDGEDPMQMFPSSEVVARRAFAPATFGVPVRTLADAIADLPPLVPPSLEHESVHERQERKDLIIRGALHDPLYVELMRACMPQGREFVLYDHVVRAVREDDRQAFSHMEEGGTYMSVPDRLRRYDSTVDRFEDRYYRLPWDLPSRAITAHIAKDGYWYIHPDRYQERTLSVREAARVQSFPDHFRFAGHRTAMYRMIGNAVPPLLARVVANLVREALDRRATGAWSPVSLGGRQLRLPVAVSKEDGPGSAGASISGR